MHRDNLGKLQEEEENPLCGHNNPVKVSTDEETQHIG